MKNSQKVDVEIDLVKIEDEIMQWDEANCPLQCGL